MTHAYLNGAGANSSFRSLYNNFFGASSSWAEKFLDSLPPWGKQWVADLRSRIAIASSSFSTGAPKNRDDIQNMTWRIVKRIFTVSNGLVLLWVLTLWWGERTVFRDSVDSCVWQSWEKWVSFLALLLHFIIFIYSYLAES